MTRPRRCLTSLSAAVAFLLSVASAGSSEQASGRSEAFEKVGQYADGGVAVALLVFGDLASVCESDRGVMILDVCDPAHPVEIGSASPAVSAAWRSSASGWMTETERRCPARAVMSREHEVPSSGSE